jgi:hypothetical protein
MIKPILSQRKTKQIESLFAAVVTVDGIEGIVRRDTPTGTQAWVTDDPTIAFRLVKLASESSGLSGIKLVKFNRSGS